jgi:hypothetical protein
VESLAPTSFSDRVCQNVTAAPSVFGIDRLFAISAPSSAAVGRSLLTFTARSNFTVNRRLDISLTGLDAAVLDLATEFAAETGFYTISITLAASLKERSAALEFRLSIRDARSACYVAGVGWQDGGCRFVREFTITVGRAICPANQHHVLSDGQLAVATSWVDPTPVSLPGVAAGTPYVESISSRTLGKGQHPVVLTWLNVAFTVGVFNVSCSFKVRLPVQLFLWGSLSLSLSLTIWFCFPFSDRHHSGHGVPARNGRPTGRLRCRQLVAGRRCADVLAGFRR